MSFVQVVVVDQVDKELAAARIGAGVGHGNGPLVVAVVTSELILDSVTRSTPASARGVSALDHEAVDDPVKDGAIVESLLYQLSEVACGNGHIIKKLEGDVPHAGVQQNFVPACLRSVFCHVLAPQSCILNSSFLVDESSF